MYNPLYPFTRAVLEATVKRGCTWFVRNTYPNAHNHFDEGIKGYFIMSHYDDPARARAHFNSIPADPFRALYDWNKDAAKEKLIIAASGPEGYKLYSTYFYPDYKAKITPALKEKINQYMYRHTDWKPGKGEKLGVDLYIQFGTLFATLGYAGQQLKVKLEDIEKKR